MHVHKPTELSRMKQKLELDSPTLSRPYDERTFSPRDATVRISTSRFLTTYMLFHSKEIIPAPRSKSQYSITSFGENPVEIELFFDTVSFAAVGSDWPALWENICFIWVQFIFVLFVDFLSLKWGCSTNINICR